MPAHLRPWTLVAALVLASACDHCGLHRPAVDSRDPARHSRPPVAGLGPAKLQLDPPGAREHRLLLDAPALARLRESAEKRTPAWVVTSERCDEAADRPVRSGYQGFDWADAVADLSLCWHASGDKRYGEAAVRYLRALLDDRFEVGDGKGGATVVTHDDGYGIRTFGAYAALGYDWLRGAPGMDAALRKRVLKRLGEWLDWYREHGYLNDRPTANYYWGYLTTLSFAGLAASGESRAADGWLQLARDQLEKIVLPAFRDTLAGGGWPEGWQYGEYTGVEIALVATAFRTGAGIDVAGKMPWLRDLVTHHVHALLPDEQSVYDGGTWGEHPAKPSALALTAASIALADVDATRAAEARWLVDHALPPLTREQVWLRLLADRPGAREVDPRRGAPTSLHLAGQGLSFMRSDWSKSAVWASFQAGPRLAEDHQDADQGHFELWRGSDGLLVDGGDSESSATINHNTLLVDDGGKNLVYAPNQGVWFDDRVRTTRFGDDGSVVVAVGDIGEAYAPKCAAEGCKRRSVTKLVRTLAYVRPSLLVIDDRIALDNPDYSVTWAAHVTTAPAIAGTRASAVVGSSRVDVQSLVPAGGSVGAVREPTPSGEGSHRMNHPWGPMWRIQIASPRGNAERRFLTFITADRADAKPPPARLVKGDGLDGALGQVDGRWIAVLFVGADGSGTATLPRADRLVIVGLAPREHYRLRADPTSTCAIAVQVSRDPAGPAATSGGFLSASPARCSTP